MKHLRSEAPREAFKRDELPFECLLDARVFLQISFCT